jgi:hypothetical protein
MSIGYLREQNLDVITRQAKWVHPGGVAAADLGLFVGAPALT